MNREWEIIGAPYDHAANEIGASAAPEAIRSYYLNWWLPKLKTNWGVTAYDGGDVLTNNSTDITKEAHLVDYGNKLYSRVLQTYDRGRVPLVIGGDHSISVGSVSAAASYVKTKHGENGRLGLLWIDAHADLNTADTGNLHGRVAAILCGVGPDQLTQIGGWSPKVDPKHLITIGVQDLMPTEREFVKTYGSVLHSIRAVDQLGISELCDRAMKSLTDHTDGIFLSLDIDVCQSESFGACAAPMIGGLTAREVCQIVEFVTGHDKFIGMDLVEYSPNKDGTGNTKQLIHNILNRALGYTVQF
jgi:arginase